MNHDQSAHAQEVAVVRMPTPISDAVDQAVDHFTKQEGISAHMKWHGADLWMVYADSIDQPTMLLVTHRVTIAAFSDDPDRLLFIPDIVVTKPDGRYILPAESRRKKWTWSIFEHSRELTDRSTSIADVAELITPGLREAWRASLTFTPDEATQPVI